MKKKTAAIGLLMSLLSLGEPVAVKAGSISTPVGFIFSIAESSKKESAYSLYKQGNTKLDTGDINGAISDYTKAIEINPNYSDAYVNRGVAKGNSGDNAGAISDYSKAIKIDQSYTLAYVNRGVAKNNIGDHLGAISDYSKAIEIDPMYINAYINRGNIKDVQLRDLKGACSDWIKASNLGDENSAKWVKEDCQ